MSDCFGYFNMFIRLLFLPIYYLLCEKRIATFNNLIYSKDSPVFRVIIKWVYPLNYASMEC